MSLFIQELRIIIKQNTETLHLQVTPIVLYRDLSVPAATISDLVRQLLRIYQVFDEEVRLANPGSLTTRSHILAGRGGEVGRFIQSCTILNLKHI